MFDARAIPSSRVIEKKTKESPGLPKPPLHMQQMFWALLPGFKPEPSSRERKTLQKKTEDFFYGPEPARSAILDEMVQDICALEFTAEMFYPAYIRGHFIEMKQMERKLMLMGNLENAYPDYFNGLPAEMRELWRAVRDFSNLLSLWVNNTLEISGLGPSEGAPLGTRPLPEEEYLDNRQRQEESVQTLLEDWERAKLTYIQAPRHG